MLYDLKGSFLSLKHLPFPAINKKKKSGDAEIDLELKKAFPKTYSRKMRSRRENELVQNMTAY